MDQSEQEDAGVIWFSKVKVYIDTSEYDEAEELLCRALVAKDLRQFPDFHGERSRSWVDYEASAALPAHQWFIKVEPTEEFARFIAAVRAGEGDGRLFANVHCRPSLTLVD